MGFLSNISKNLENRRSRNKIKKNQKRSKKLATRYAKEATKDIKRESRREKRSVLNDPDILTYISGVQGVLGEFKNNSIRGVLDEFNKIRPPIYDSNGTDPCPINKNILFPYNYFVKCDQIPLNN